MPALRIKGGEAERDEKGEKRAREKKKDGIRDRRCTYGEIRYLQRASARGNSSAGHPSEAEDTEMRRAMSVEFHSDS